MDKPSDRHSLGKNGPGELEGYPFYFQVLLVVQENGVLALKCRTLRDSLPSRHHCDGNYKG